MKEGWWIDERTRMVQLGCRAANTNINRNFLAFYTVEFSASGMVNPMEPFISVGMLNQQIHSITNSVNALLVFFFYFLNDEIFEIWCFGIRQYCIEGGFLNAMDWIGLCATFAAYLSLGRVVATIPSLHGDPYLGLEPHRNGHYAQMSAEGSFTAWIAITVFFLWFRALKFTKNIPIMASIGTLTLTLTLAHNYLTRAFLTGNTFSNAALQLGAFALVMMALSIAFANLFNILLSSGLRGYATFYDTLQLVTLEGLMGNMEVGEISLALPTLGPLFYSIYLFSLVFVGFTILISIITDSYNKCKNAKLDPGLIGIVADELGDRWYDFIHSDDDDASDPEGGMKDAGGANHGGVTPHLNDGEFDELTVLPEDSFLAPPTAADSKVEAAVARMEARMEVVLEALAAKVEQRMLERMDRLVTDLKQQQDPQPTTAVVAVPTKVSDVTTRDDAKNLLLRARRQQARASVPLV